MWFIVVCTLIDNEYPPLLFSEAFFRIVSACTWSVHNILTTVMTHIVVDKSTHHAKPDSIYFGSGNALECRCPCEGLAVIKTYY